MRMTSPKANQLTISTRCRSTGQFIGTFHRYADAESIFVATLVERPPGFATGFSFALADGTPVLRGTGVVLQTWKTVDNPYKLPGSRLGIKWLSPRSVAVFRQLLIPRTSSTLPSVSPPPPRSRPPTDDPTVPPPAPGVPDPACNESWSGPTRTELKRPEPVGSDTAASPELSPYITTRPYFTSPLPEAPASPPPEAPASPPPEAPASPPPLDRVTSPSVETEPVAPAEARTPASELILPANPLTNLTDLSLDGFVECTLYEETVPPPDGELAYATPVETSTPHAPIAAGSADRSRRWMLDVALLSATAGFIVLGSGVLPSAANPTSRDHATQASSTNVAAIPSHDQAPPVVGDGPCRLFVSSTPTGSIVALDGVRRGASPISIATSCGRHRVEISEAHHQTMAAWVTLTVDQPERIEVPLARPIHAVAVTTRPSGAAIYIDGSPAGTTPMMLNILGHVPMTVEIKKAGYQPLIQHLYSTTPRDKIAIQMIKASPGMR